MFVKKLYYINISSNVYYDNAWVNDISKFMTYVHVPISSFNMSTTFQFLSIC